MEEKGPYVEVAVTLPVDGTYTYSVPPSLVAGAFPGMRVLVPFGRRRVSGYVLAQASENRLQAGIKPVIALLDREPLFPEALVPFFRWVADYYLHPVGEVIQTALPAGLSVKEVESCSLTVAGTAALESGALSSEHQRWLSAIQDSGAKGARSKALRETGLRHETLLELEMRGWVLRGIGFAGGRTGPKLARFAFRGPSRTQITGRAAAGPRGQVLDLVAAAGEVSLSEIERKIPGAGRALRALEISGHIGTREHTVYRDPFGEAILPDAAPELTVEQARATAAVRAALSAGFTAYLLTGVTGSGKTEVYLQLAAEVIGLGQTVLVLVPEIALISQMERRFRARFGETVAVLHSGLSPGERFDQWMRIKRGAARIVVGARSAVFAPLARPGLVIVDEEHDGSYKQESGLPYNARDLAVVRAKLCDSVALLGSATPSLQSLYNRQRGKFRGLTLSCRVADRPMPVIEVIDLRENRGRSGIGRFITPALEQAIGQTLERGEQSLLFLNRRGYAGFSICGACGESLRCPHCAVSLTMHRGAGAHRCHYCGFSRPLTVVCPACGAGKMRALGLGTERVEAAVAALFPEARVARMDRDSTARRGSLVTLLKGLRDRTIDILVGTQMVAKGHDFPHLTLVGILCADLSLHFPDFRAGERTFQLLAQVAGRAGRGDAPGRVMLQTYNPDHFTIRCARDGDLAAFARQEMGYRRELGYPPLTRMVLLRVQGRDAGRTREQAQSLGEACRAAASDAVTVLGPIEAPMVRLADHYRWQVILKASAMAPLQRVLRRLMAASPFFNSREVRVFVDVDPYFLL